MDKTKTTEFVDSKWDDSIVPTLVEFIEIPNKSPSFDADWAAHGHMKKAVDLVAGWCKAQPIEGLTLEVVEIEGRTPLILMEVPGTGQRTADDCVLLYGHLDKQPEMEGWDPDLGPWKPVIRGDKLYGRGGADDGYAAFASLTALGALQKQGIPHARCVIMIEASEESGSPDLPAYIDALADRIGTPSLVVCLDSGCGNYDQLWCTTSLRGMIGGVLTIDLLSEGVHSGDASGIVPSTFRIARQLLSRLEDERTGEIVLRGLHVPIPEQRKRQAAVVGKVMAQDNWMRFPFVDGGKPAVEDLAGQVLARTWKPALSVTGAGGLPSPSDAGNVLRPRTQLVLSMRLPPTMNPDDAYKLMKKTLEADPPYGAKVRFEGEAAPGWNAPELAAWLEKSIAGASEKFFSKAAVHNGEGGSIPFMGMLGEKFPKAQFMITGVLGPASNAHGPNEFLHIPTGKRLTSCVAQVIEDHYNRP